MKQTTMFVIVALIIGIVGMYVLVVTSGNDAEHTQQNDSLSVSAVPLFEDYGVGQRDMLQGDPMPIDLTSSSIGVQFETRLTEGIKEGANFAGHFTIVEWGCGTMCVQFAIVDLRTGVIYDIPWGVETGLEYRLGSNLLILNPIGRTREVYPDISVQPDWLRTIYYEWDGDMLHLIKAFQVIENGIIDADLHG